MTIPLNRLKYRGKKFRVPWPTRKPRKVKCKPFKWALQKRMAVKFRTRNRKDSE